MVYINCVLYSSLSGPLSTQYTKTWKRKKISRWRLNDDLFGLEDNDEFMIWGSFNSVLYSSLSGPLLT